MTAGLWFPAAFFPILPHPHPRGSPVGVAMQQEESEDIHGGTEPSWDVIWG